MTTELLQNLIPNLTEKINLNDATATLKNAPKTLGDDFLKAFDNAKSKYLSKDSNTFKPSAESETRINTVSQKKQLNEINGDKKDLSISNSDNLHSQKEVSNKEVQQNGPKQVANTIKEEQKVAQDTKENTQTQVDDETSNTTLTEESETNTTKNKKNIYESILNSLILGTSETKTEDDETSTKEDQTKITNIEDVMLETAEKTIETTEQNSEISEEQDTSILNSVTENSEINTFKETEKISAELATTETNETKKINTNNLQSESNFSKEIEKLLSAEDTKEQSPIEPVMNTEDIEIEKPQAEDLLIKVEDVMENAVDDIATEIANSETTKSTSKLTQDVLDEMDVTVRSIDTKDMQKLMQQHSQQESFANSQGNAQENIIRMSIESTSPESANTTEFVINTPQNVSIDKASNLSMTQPTLNAAPKSISDAEILSQINSKLNIQSENQTQKVNIILKPENLGKVSVEIIQTKDGVSAKMVAETTQVKDLLDKSIESLKNTLATQGVNINNVTVKVEETTAGQNAGFSFEQEQFNQETANQSNKQKNSEHTQNTNNSEQINSSEQTNTTEEIENADILEKEHEAINENGSISISV